MPTAPLRVVSLQVRDVLGAREFNLEPGRITVIKGRNGTGKSSALAALQKALEGGNLAKLARVPGPGEEEPEPEVVLVLAGDGSETYRVKRKGDKVDVRARVGDTAAFESVGKPVAWLRSLFDPAGANPVAFLQAKDADRALMLLEALPLKMDRAALLAEMGVDAKDLPPIPTGLHPLEECSLIRDATFARRHGVNRDADGKAKSADQLRRSMPAVAPSDDRARIDALEAEVGPLAEDLGSRETRVCAEHEAALRAANTEQEAAEAKIAAAFKVAAHDARAQHAAWAASRRAEVEAEIATAAQKVEGQIHARKATDEARLDELDRARAAKVTAADQTHDAAQRDLGALRNTLAAKREQLATLRAQADGAAAYRALDAQATAFEEEAERLKAESARLTAALDALDAFRRRLAEDLPIPGLEIRDRQITVGGIPYDQLNTAARVDLAVQVACLRAKGARLPVVFVDGAEALDHEHFAILVDRLKAAGVQAFVGRVTDEDFGVETLEPGA